MRHFMNKKYPVIFKCILCGMPIKDHVKTEIKPGEKFKCIVKMKVDMSKWRWIYGSAK
jgi:hypothetical protein